MGKGETFSLRRKGVFQRVLIPRRRPSNPHLRALVSSPRVTVYSKGLTQCYWLFSLGWIRRKQNKKGKHNEEKEEEEKSVRRKRRTLLLDGLITKSLTGKSMSSPIQLSPYSALIVLASYTLHVEGRNDQRVLIIVARNRFSLFFFLRCHRVCPAGRHPTYRVFIAAWSLPFNSSCCCFFSSSSSSSPRFTETFFSCPLPCFITLSPVRLFQVLSFILGSGGGLLFFHGNRRGFPLHLIGLGI